MLARARFTRSMEASIRAETAPAAVVVLMVAVDAKLMMAPPKLMFLGVSVSVSLASAFARKRRPAVAVMLPSSRLAPSQRAPVGCA
jgi:hypothetical protein